MTHKLFLLAMALGYVVLLTFFGVSDYFTGNGIDDAVMYHLQYGLAGAGFLEYFDLIATAALAFVLGVAFLSWVFFKKHRHDPSRPARAKSTLAVYLLLAASLLLNPAVHDLCALFKSSSLPRPSAAEPFAANADTFDEFYRKPWLAAAEDTQKNLVFIYAESLERTYFDETVFPGLIKGLRELESQSTYFTNVGQVVGTSWTVGGMTASQCGVPLFAPSHENSMSGMDQFLPTAVGLGDLLRDAGYHLVYMGGAKLRFAGKGKLFRTHGFAEVLGLHELLPKIEDPENITPWGLYDDSLLEIVYERFLELSAGGKKFGLFTLTLDTHQPEGHMAKSCPDEHYNDGSNKMLNAVACADYLITDFINKILASPYADRTVVVLVSDHLAMRNRAYDLLQKKARKNLFMILEPNQKKPTEVTTAGSTLDIGPTVLPFLGFDGEIGLGRNLADATEQTEES
ncbi:sulfatase-like hydrolase/transferase [Thermodesulfobacteriota bacterium]